MRFDPATANADLLPEDWYDALVLHAYEKTSKAGHPCMVVTFKVYGGKQPTIDRYFVMDSSSGVGGMRKLCAALGISEEFKTGEIAPEILKGRGVQVMVKVQKDETGQWDDKNVAAQFRAQPTTPATNPAHVFDPTDPALRDQDDAVPF